MKIYKSLTELIGNTPLMELSNYNKRNDLKATVLGKLEYFNPAGSVKDRIAKYNKQYNQKEYKKFLANEIEEKERELELLKFAHKICGRKIIK